MTLTKSHIVDALAQKNGYSKNNGAELVEIFLDIMKGALGSGEDIMISGFGKFSVKEKRHRKGRNPATGGDMILASRRVVTFKCSGKLRDMVNR